METENAYAKNENSEFPEKLDRFDIDYFCKSIDEDAKNYETLRQMKRWYRKFGLLNATPGEKARYLLENVIGLPWEVEAIDISYSGAQAMRELEKLAVLDLKFRNYSLSRMIKITFRRFISVSREIKRAMQTKVREVN